MLSRTLSYYKYVFIKEKSLIFRIVVFNEYMVSHLMYISKTKIGKSVTMMLSFPMTHRVSVSVSKSFSFSGSGQGHIQKNLFPILNKYL